MEVGEFPQLLYPPTFDIYTGNNQFNQGDELMEGRSFILLEATYSGAMYIKGVDDKLMSA